MFLKRCMILLVVTAGIACKLQAQDSKAAVKELAQNFVKAADIQDAALMKGLLYPESLQFVAMGEKLIKYPAEQYIAAVEAKKLGGEPRVITFKNVEIVGDKTAVASLDAVSSKYHFNYHLSMAKSEGKWVIIGILTEIKGVSG